MTVEKVDITVLKALRASSGAGIAECKKALLETQGDLEKAKQLLHEFAKVRAEKKASRPTAEGRFSLAIDEGSHLGCILEVRCETDFVSRHESFQLATQTWANELLHVASTHQALSLDSVKSFLEEKRVELVQKTDENIQITQFCLVRGEHLIAYQHGNGKICLLAAVDASAIEGQQERAMLLQQLAAQLALGASDSAFFKEADQSFELQLNEQCIEIPIDEKRLWQEAKLFSDETKSLRNWLESTGIRVNGYARFSLSATSEDLGQKFSEDVQALLSKYGKAT